MIEYSVGSMEDGKVIIYTDGAARGNPGPSASGFVVYVDGRLAGRRAEYNGAETNNFAEYKAVLMALEWCAANVGGFFERKVEVYSDSELVVRQLVGRYKVRSEKMKSMNDAVKAMCARLGWIRFYNVPREERHIKEVDRSLNNLLDSIEGHAKD
jgi:ribonuclease HI